MPTRVTKRSPGKPAMMALEDMPTASVPMRKAMASASAPMLIGSAVATTNITTSPRIEAVCGDIVVPSQDADSAGLGATLALSAQQLRQGRTRGRGLGHPRQGQQSINGGGADHLAGMDEGLVVGLDRVTVIEVVDHHPEALAHAAGSG